MEDRCKTRIAVYCTVARKLCTFITFVGRFEPGDLGPASPRSSWHLPWRPAPIEADMIFGSCVMLWHFHGHRPLLRFGMG